MTRSVYQLLFFKLINFKILMSDKDIYVGYNMVISNYI